MNKASGGDRISAELFKILKDDDVYMLYSILSKYGKLSSGHRTGKGQISFQPQRKTMPKNIQITAQLCSFHKLVRLCSKSFKFGFSSTWTENFQIYKVGLKKAEEPEIKLLTFIG